ncbi:MAG: RluA family pseudouridine synthase [Deltaproteobacteria bacterium HGW-Deltaproteobacteria-12]|jgi:RluA family pseudouridine synthase|nr:MAG: RluA family pseudouridine synthase [Deltaproteobacteria bacterium HGW-Deltaproteobacteria-12]
MTRKRIIKSRVPVLHEAQRLDSYLSYRFTYLTEELWRKEILEGKLSLDGMPAFDPAAALKGGEMLAWNGSRIIEPEVDDRITILYEDEWFVAVNKTGNLPVHPAGRYFNNTLVALLEERYRRKVYPLHRIDRETSGIILLALDGKSTASLAVALAQGSKEYLALVHGIFPAGELIVDLPLGRDKNSAISKKRKAWPGGSETALTRFVKIVNAGDMSLVRCFPATGRLHQIRAHLLAAGYPIVGDKLYGRDESAFLNFIRHGLTAELSERLILPRQALHAARLVFLHPRSKKEIIIRAPLPPMFSECIRLRSDNGYFQQGSSGGI